LINRRAGFFTGERILTTRHRMGASRSISTIHPTRVTLALA
jgi:hypothetical protein